MRALKLLVVVMGVLLIGGIVVLVVADHRPRQPSRRRAALRPAVPASTRVSLPAGRALLGSRGGGDRLVVRVALAAGGEELLPSISRPARWSAPSSSGLQPEAAAP